jgi:DNA repair protein RadD
MGRPSNSLLGRRYRGWGCHHSGARPSHAGTQEARKSARQFQQEDTFTVGDSHHETARPPDDQFLVRSRSPLFSYQQEIVDELAGWLASESDNRTALVSLPTGAGKTRTGIWFLRQQAESGHLSRAVWIAPSIELVRQAIDAVQLLWREFPSAVSLRVKVSGLEHRTSKPSEPTFNFMTAQLASRRIRELEQYQPDFLVFDEAHQAVARTFSKIIRSVLKTDIARVIGLTATPGRTGDLESDDLRMLFGDHLTTSKELGRSPVTELQSRGILSRLQMHEINLPLQWEQVRVSSLQKKSLSLDQLAQTPARFWATIKTIEELRSGSQCLVFAASVAHCYALAGALVSKGIRAAVVSHATSPTERRRTLLRFETGDLQVVVNKSILAMGYDCPKITDVVLTSPIRSPILWEQILGRASRGPRVGGSEIGRIWELDNHRAMHRQVLSYARFLGDLWS